MSLAPPTALTTSATVVEGLLAAQFPALTALPVTHVDSGWDNDLFRVGDTLVARLPRRELAVELLEKEVRWLPTIGSLVDLPIPQPVMVGTPSEEFEWPWVVTPWVPGTPASALAPAERRPMAEPLADFLWTLHVPATHGAPVNPYRAGSLAAAEFARRPCERLARWAETHGAAEADALRDRWEAWAGAPDYDGVDVWVHGDLHPDNIITDGSGELASVVDWGDLTTGDPACDLATAWLTFDEPGRRVFRDRYDQGQPAREALWTRAKAWALHLGLVLAVGNDDRPAQRAVGEAALRELLTEPV